MLEKKNVGFGLTGSFCTLSTAIEQMRRLSQMGCNIIPVVSYSVATMDTRFGKSADFIAQIEDICGRSVIATIPEAEPIGPKNLFDIMVVMPCTGNTMAKIYAGITDTPVTLACKAHLRNLKPLLLCPATNDGLSMSAKNIGGLMNSNNIYFMPFGQDDCIAKQNSLIAKQENLIEAIEAALRNEKLQPQLF